jgi:DNA-binding Xre family transcriptional regulator
MRRPLEVRLDDPHPKTKPFQASKWPDSEIGRVVLRLTEVARAKGLVNSKGAPNRARIQALTGVADDTLYYLLRYPELSDRIHFRTLAKLCHGLGVKPSELLEYIPPGGGETPLSDLYKAGES